MKKPDWFMLLEQWKTKGMGEYGVTLPFLVGALGRSAPQLLKEIINSPVSGYVTEVRWCADLSAPTFSVTKTTQSTMQLKSSVPDPNGETSLGFSQDLHSTLGLNCKDASECLKKLIDHAAPAIERHTYSRNLSTVTRKTEWGPFTVEEINFIKEVIGRYPKEV